MNTIRRQIDRLFEAQDIPVDSEAWKASGIVYGFGQGMLTPEEFRESYGFDPRKYPQYFEVTRRTNLVMYTPLYRKHLEAVRAQTQRNFGALGVGA
jgi:hypothetical protein